MAAPYKTLFLSLALAAPLVYAQKLLAGPGAPSVLAADLRIGNSQALRNMAAQLFVFANQARAVQGLQPLEWDPALATAALNHCARAAAEGPLSHQYAGEPDLTQRAASAGARFSLIAENIAEGYEPSSIHQQWMHSPGHRGNLLNPAVNRMGVAVVAEGNMFYAVEDFARAVPALSREQVEGAVANLVEGTGVVVHANSPGARLACAQDGGLPASLDNRRPEFIMRWQTGELDRLPEALLERIATGRYHEAAVGSCSSPAAASAFTNYRIAVLLLRPVSGASRTLVSSK